MAKNRKTKAPLETNQEHKFWASSIRGHHQMTCHLTSRETCSGRPIFATEEMVGFLLPDGATRLIEREELAYIALADPPEHE
ncbi:MAG: hypothetical protein NW208_01200 [Bryobacter sp.]|nr:hypothetical protein [Bryobacter sp.]